jgi:Tol biopolymer transport system component
LTWIVAAALLVASLGAAGTATANFRGSNGLIAFDSWTGTSQDIGVFDPTGTAAPTFLTTTADFSEHAPRWSPDGARIVYMGHPQNGTDDQRSLQDIFVMDADGQHKTRLTNTPYQEEVPAWTADGRIVFCGQSPTDPDNWDIYRINADGTGLTNLTNTDANTFECWPSPAPNGNKIAFTRATETSLEIWTMKLDGSGLRRVTDGRNSDWSPTGNDLVFTRDNPSGSDRDIWVVHSDGTDVQQLTNTPNRRETFPSWSPDGTKIVYPALVHAGVFNIFALDIATRNEHLLLADSPPTTYSVAYPTWQPLGKPCRRCDRAGSVGPA